LYGRAGEHEYTDEVVNRPEVTALRSKVDAIVDDNIDEASVDINIRTTDGRDLHIFIEHAVGSVEKPLTEAQLKAKFMDQSEPILGQKKASGAWSLSREIAGSKKLGEFIAAATV
jgi:2-methylcitrate dehydratase PrpD